MIASDSTRSFGSEFGHVLSKWPIKGAALVLILTLFAGCSSEADPSPVVLAERFNDHIEEIRDNPKDCGEIVDGLGLSCDDPAFSPSGLSPIEFAAILEPEMGYLRSHPEERAIFISQFEAALSAELSDEGPTFIGFVGAYTAWSMFGGDESGYPDDLRRIEFDG